ncbi:response regulator transcription factor [Streptomyces sp. ITFR-6]|uniref:response regulator transcription factor n=1 Tax=Streptomyces sp. ITFR-6 TaxID=3075197 RepID=UPI00288B49F2|nr:response regulator transcription factor [Streptomyces sp. ITFR-6]WNI32564.1 response regulator transcription factor [Streptomyces sp. ITFR-6]
MEIHLLIIGEDSVTLAGLEAIVDQDENIVLPDRALDAADWLRCPDEDEVKPHVIILGEPPTKQIICENVQQGLTKYGHERSRPKILVVSQNDDDEMIVAALRVGVSGYLARIGSPDELLDSIRIVAKGGAAFSRRIAARFSSYFSSMQIQNTPDPTDFCGLTSRELEILDLLAHGLGNQQIARRLFLAEKTVRNYVSRIFTKLEVHDRASAAV